ncbi:MAG TPA: septation protein SepH [Marmoricola sp.]
MQHLTPVGLSKDGTTLVLVSDTGEEFAVPVDHKLRAALRGDHARLGQLEMKMESTLRPRDIQARIRGGESAEDVAAAAQTTVDAIMGFAAPVLAERAHVAESAQKSSIRRRNNEATTAARTLDQASRSHLTTLGVRADDVDWDAWRRDDGRWTLVAEYAVSGSPRRAEFTYDQPGRYVVADNEEARLLTGESGATTAADPPVRRLAAVPSSSDDELPLGDDAIELVRGGPVEGHGVAADAELDDRGDADWIADTTEPETAADREDTTSLDERVSEETDTPAADESRPPKSHKKGRSSVPSWDEIMFGSGKGE